MSRVSTPGLIDHDASPNCSFPSITPIDEVVKLAPTSLVHCSVGPLDAGAKVLSYLLLYQYIFLYLTCFRISIVQLILLDSYVIYIYKLLS